MFARVRSYDILVSFVFMPLGLAVFPLIAQAIGYEWTLLGAAVGIALTNLVVALTPGVHEVREEPLATVAEPRAA